MIDQIYVINLAESTDRRQRVESQLSNLNITNYTFFNAIRPTMDILNKYPNFRRDISTNIRIGELGCLLSHVGVFKDALDKNYENIIVLEDDVNILDSNFVEKITEKINLLDNKFDILYLGANHKQPAKRCVIDGIYETTRSNGSFAYCITNNAMKRLVVDYSYKFSWDVHWKKFDKKSPLTFYCVIPHLINIVDCNSLIQLTHTCYAKSVLDSQKVLLQGLIQGR
jgi:glycosyl transferase, family 25